MIRPGFLETGCEELVHRIERRQTLAITTPTVDRLYGKPLQECIANAHRSFRYEVVPCAEHTKDISTLMRVVEIAHDFGLSRDGVLLAIGGGVCSDVISLAASLIRRGIDYIVLPTTFVGQIDAGIAVKGGVNYKDSKNYLGCFYPPAAAFIDPGFLSSLPPRQIQAGFAEAIKLALIGSADLFKIIQSTGQELSASRFQSSLESTLRIVAECVEVTLEELGKNVFEVPPWKRPLDFWTHVQPIVGSCFQIHSFSRARSGD
jgi:3-dehydroquinate synthase